MKRKHHIICAIFISLLLIFFSTFLVITLVLNSGNVSSSLLFGIILSAILLVLCSIVVFCVTEVNINKYENLYENEKNKAFERLLKMVGVFGTFLILQKKQKDY